MDIKSVLPPDAIPSIDDPTFDRTYLGDGEDEVIVIEAEPPRAYPLRILNFHEIVNDVVDGEPLAITWCPLCGSAVVYERRVDDRTLTFGVSGKLADDDLVMYDRETGSEWKQSLGTCISGDFKGCELTIKPAPVTTWKRFKSEYPDGLALQPDYSESEAASDSDEPAPVDYSMEPYDAYFEADGFGLAAHRGESDSRTWDGENISPKTRVLGIKRNGEAVGFPYPIVDNAGGVVTTSVGGDSLVVMSVDGELHAFEDPGFELEVDDGTIIGDDTRWNPTTGVATDGRQLDRIPAQRLFAFAWQDDHGSDAFYRLDE